MYLRNLGYTVKRLRLSNRLSQEELAWKAQLDRRTISSIENNNGDATVYFRTITALAETFGMRPSEFLQEVEKDMHRKDR